MLLMPHPADDPSVSSSSSVLPSSLIFAAQTPAVVPHHSSVFATWQFVGRQVCCCLALSSTAPPRGWHFCRRCCCCFRVLFVVVHTVCVLVVAKSGKAIAQQAIANRNGPMARNSTNNAHRECGKTMWRSKRREEQQEMMATLLKQELIKEKK